MLSLAVKKWQSKGDPQRNTNCCPEKATKKRAPKREKKKKKKKRGPPLNETE
jgi:hypothetical protein